MPNEGHSPVEAGRALIFVTPSAVDGAVALRVLSEGHLAARVVGSLGALVGAPIEEIGCLLVVEEALRDIASLQAALDGQPPWSDLPIILIARENTSLQVLQDAFPGSGNITLLQRPLHPTGLLSAARVALRARARQLQVRDLLLQRDRAVHQRDEFLAMLAHELRNPLAPIRNAVYILGTLPIEDPLFARCRGLIDKQARHITRLVDDLLDVSRLERGKVQLKLQRVDLRECAVAAIEASHAVVASHAHVVALEAPEIRVPVAADPVRLEQVISNLLLNAAKFTPEGGRIRVEVSSDGPDGVVAVTDNGMGIKPEMLDAIFDLFMQDDVTLARSRGGLGIGLTLVKRLVEMHGGSVRASSAGAGAGARFEVRLPLQQAAESEPLRDKPTVRNVACRVLIVEDGLDTRETLGMLVRQWQHDVLFASNGPEGLARARDSRPDVMLIDIGLPGFDGYQLARKLRSEGTEWSRRVRLIALTGYGQAADRERAAEAGFDLHLLKPVDPVYLQRLLGEEVAAIP